MNYLKFKRALQISWGKDTAYRKDTDNWTSENPAVGQCAISALLFNELFGGKIYSGISNNGVEHYWNRRFGIKVDLTKQQFPHGVSFKEIRKWDRDELLATGNVRERYNILRARVMKNIANKNASNR